MRGITVLASKGGAIATGLAPVLAGGLRQQDRESARGLSVSGGGARRGVVD